MYERTTDMYCRRRFGNLIGVSYNQLITWDKNRKLKANRDFHGRAYYTIDHVHKIKYTPKQFAKKIGVSEQKLRKMNKTGDIVVYIDKDKHKYYTHAQYLEYMAINQNI